jgi:uncharacterized YigZ family protein
MNCKTVKDQSTIEFEEKKSIFIGNTKRVESEEDAKAFINIIKSKYKEARHNVYAYVIGDNQGIQRYSDDGEPQGTAGIPVLEVIKKNSLTDVVIVVTRYFGGILLGAGGLTRAYSKTASLSINESGIVEKVQGVCVSIETSYENVGRLQYLFGQNMWFVEESIYTDKVTFKLFIENSQVDIVTEKVTEATNGGCDISLSDAGLYFKLENRLYKEF